MNGMQLQFIPPLRSRFVIYSAWELIASLSIVVPASVEFPRPHRVARGGTGRAREEDGEQRRQAGLDEF